MGSNGASSGSGGGVGPAGLVTSTGKFGTEKDAKKTKNRNEFSSGVKKIGTFIAKGGILGAIIKNITNKKKSGVAPAEINSKNTFGGNVNKGGINNISNNSNVVVPLTPSTPTTIAPIAVAPTIAEVSQSTTTDADGFDLRKTKAKGRSMTILTSSKGIKQDNKLTLGKKSLLGS
tara:strand:- start:17 stop:541 length:525 start_codon:yes stop_codon:yes gene_type:complete